MEKNVKELELIRSEKYGFGFSIIGGVGSELPPVICDIVENSPADCCDEVREGLLVTHRFIACNWPPEFCSMERSRGWYKVVIEYPHSLLTPSDQYVIIS